MLGINNPEPMTQSECRLWRTSALGAEVLL